jgi:hypothetical protein
MHVTSHKRLEMFGYRFFFSSSASFLDDEEQVFSTTEAKKEKKKNRSLLSFSEDRTSVCRRACKSS